VGEEVTNMHYDTDVVVIGGGLAGLLAATSAAQRGSRVTLLEGHLLGGRAQSDQRRGYVFNRGPHALYRKGAGWAALSDVGVVPRGKPPLGISDVRGELAGALVAVPTTPGALLRGGGLKRRDRFGLGAVLARLPRDPADLRGLSAWDWLNAVTSRPVTRQVVAALLRLSTYSDDLSSLSADAAIAQLQLARHGVVYLDDGWQQLVDALATTAQRAGVLVRTAVEVTNVVEEGAVVTVATAHEHLVAKAAVVAAGGPVQAAQLLGSCPWGDLGARVTASCLDLGLNKLPARPFILGLDTATYCSVHAPGAALAPPDGVAVAVAGYGYADEATLSAVAAQAGVTDSDVVERRYLHSLIVAHTQPRPGSGLAGRPGARVPGRTRTFVAGDWVGPVGLIGDAAMASGRAAGLLAATVTV